MVVNIHNDCLAVLLYLPVGTHIFYTALINKPPPTRCCWWQCSFMKSYWLCRLTHSYLKSMLEESPFLANPRCILGGCSVQLHGFWCFFFRFIRFCLKSQTTQSMSWTKLMTSPGIWKDHMGFAPKLRNHEVPIFDKWMTIAISWNQIYKFGTAHPIWSHWFARMIKVSKWSDGWTTDFHTLLLINGGLQSYHFGRKEDNLTVWKWQFYSWFCP